MRVTIVTLGTQGDVQPLVSLGLGLQQRGHAVTIASSVDFTAFVAKYGLDFYPLPLDLRGLFRSAEGVAVREAGRNTFKSLGQLIRLVQPFVKQLLDETWTASQQAEAVIYAGAACAIPIDHIRERLGIPCYQATLQPLLSPTRCFAHPNFWAAPDFLSAAPWLIHRYNRFTYLLLQQLIWQPFRQAVNRWRRETLGLPPLPWAGPYGAYDRQQLPCLHGYSAELVPRPLDWPDWQHLTGYWFLPAPSGWQPPPALLDFLAAGPPPLYFGFGSMSSRHPEQMAQIVLKALAQTGQRGILVTGWGGLEQSHLPETVLKLEVVPHDWLFPRVAAAIHHGGAGTTAAVLRAGIPAIIVPFYRELAFWGEQVARLGAGPEPIPRWRLTTPRLVSAIQRVLHEGEMRERAAGLGRRLRAEDGVGRAAQIFQDSLFRS